MTNSLSILLLLAFGSCSAQAPVVLLNQLGFYKNGPKIAIVTADAGSSKFYLLSKGVKDTVFRGNLAQPVQSTNSSTITRVADFSSFKKNGSYYLVADTAKSFVFTISPNANHAVAVASLKGFYYQRVSMPLLAAYAGRWSRPAGHPDTAVLIHASAASEQRPTGTVISTPGGWYDAGDYNKYVVNSGISMGTLLAAYEDFPSYFDTLKTNIPESRDEVPDILNEAIYNLRWMLSMQDPNDGGVYNKCTNAAFDGMVMPGVTKAPRYVVAKGTAATLDLAAVAAQSARILRKFNRQLPGLSDSCLRAAKAAWKWAEKNPALAYDQNTINKSMEPKITTGGYGDRNFSDEWFWAATELYATSTDTACLRVILQHINTPLSIPSWANVHMLGCYTLIRHEKLLPKLNNDIATLKTRLVAMADTLMNRVGQSAFQTVMGQTKRDFNWGSNSNAGNQGMLLTYAYFISKNRTYVEGALSNLDYIMGRNATGYCFVTGLGSKSTMHPHHRQSVSDGITEPVPGLLAGGPNPGMQDHVQYAFKEPETAYADMDASYASNEIAINWNAPLVYLSNAVEALQKKMGY